MFRKSIIAGAIAIASIATTGISSAQAAGAGAALAGAGAQPAGNDNIVKTFGRGRGGLRPPTLRLPPRINLPGAGGGLRRPPPGLRLPPGTFPRPPSVRLPPGLWPRPPRRRARRFRFRTYGSVGPSCRYYYRKWRRTGRRYWYRKYRRCLRNNW